MAMNIEHRKNIDLYKDITLFIKILLQVFIIVSGDWFLRSTENLAQFWKCGASLE